jgi:hypothetical protein
VYVITVMAVQPFVGPCMTKNGNICAYFLGIIMCFLKVIKSRRMDVACSRNGDKREMHIGY